MPDNHTFHITYHEIRQCRADECRAEISARSRIEVTVIGDIKRAELSRLPLSGFRVIAFEQAVAAPLCTRLLHDLGADVIKIERPAGGDFSRQWDSAGGGLSSYFVWLNRGKQSLAIDMGSAGARSVLERLVRDADVFVQNAAPRTTRRLHLDHESLSSINPALVHCSISGYGADGPFGDRRAYDLLVQGEVGLLSITGTPEQRAKVAVPVCDIAAGMYAAQAVLAALLARQRGLPVPPIDITMFDAMMDWLGGPLTAVANGADGPEPSGMRHSMIVPYGPFETADRHLVSVAVEHEREWVRFCRDVLHRPELLDAPEFRSNALRVRNRNHLEPLIEREFRCHDRATWIQRLADAEIAYGDVRRLDDAIQHPQFIHRGLLTHVATPTGTISSIASAMRFPGYVGDEPPPELGDHTLRVLHDVGYSQEEIASLREQKVVWSPE